MKKSVFRAKQNEKKVEEKTKAEEKKNQPIRRRIIKNDN